MILFRYLAREVLNTTFVVTILLVLIFLSNQFVRLLSKIAAGKLAISLLLHLILWEVPVLLGYLLPVGLFVGILLSYGRMYADNEMTVLRACGFGQGKLMAYTMSFGLFVLAIVAAMVMWVTPHVLAKQERAISSQGANLLLQTIIPGRFQSLHQGDEVFYVNRISSDREHLSQIFIAQYQKPKNEKPRWTIMTADHAEQETDSKSGRHLLVAHNGYRYNGTPGHNDYDIAKFGQYGVILPENTKQGGIMVKAVDTTKLYREKNKNISYEAEWQWRWSIPFSIILLVLLGVPIAKVNPRQGKFAKLLPATLIYIIYANMLFVCRDWIESHTVPTWLGMWTVHIPLLFIALFVLIGRERLWRLVKPRRRFV